jgi:hypothetical protein
MRNQDELAFDHHRILTDALHLTTGLPRQVVDGMTTRALRRQRRRDAITRYRAARAAFDTYTRQYEADKAASCPVPSSEADDLTYQRLNTEFDDAARTAPWWARLIWR